jgi:hypothetical protein
MGIGKRDIDAMSLWEFGATVEGYERAHNPEGDKGALTDQEADAIGAWLDGR